MYPPNPSAYRKAIFDLLSHTRNREVFRDGLYMEHGHFLDASNRDGAAGGHSMTQAVFEYEAMRALDPDRRRIWIVGAAARFIENRATDEPFFLYAMAHTHSPYLCEVAVREKVVTE